ncbi:MAG: diphosphate--fructose-6-phosphate 1-phosphotransferase [Spirochaetaceae bacterium]|nr:diphosphate--fructose-6-phosphate 1-phosphotransferase [Spirochaetaceae bacterium]
MANYSVLDNARKQYNPKLPECLSKDISAVGFEEVNSGAQNPESDKLKEILPKTFGGKYVKFVQKTAKSGTKPFSVGIVLSGGQAPGGHNVIAGIFDSLKKINKDSKLIGFLGGPQGILDDKIMEITKEIIDNYRNTGGFDLIGSGRTKIETDEQFEKSLQVCKSRKLDALVVIGGDDSNTNAALLAEFFAAKNENIAVIGVPKTIDGDLKTDLIEASFGFDTAAKTFSELIGNVERDSKSAKKYWHFIKLMGRSASHIALECALQTQPNCTIISEEVKAKNQSLESIINDITKIVMDRGNNKENFGVALIPEGLIEFIPEIGALIKEINKLLGDNEQHFSTLKEFEQQSEWLIKNLSQTASKVFSSLPKLIREQLLMDRDPHGNVQVSRIETEKLIVAMVDTKLKELKESGQYKGKFDSLTHFFGYEGRCAFPSNFDADYCYSLGYCATVLIALGLTGYMTSITGLSKPVSQWVPGGVPISLLMNLEERKGKMKPVIKKALVELDGVPFKTFAKNRDEWAKNTSFIYPGAIQYFGPDEVCNQPTITLTLEKGK